MTSNIGQYLRQTQDRYPHGIVFHYFRGGTYKPAQGAISAEEFEQMLLFVGLENILPAREWLDRAEEGKLKETDLCITFDDGLREQYDIAVPILKKYDQTAFFFIYSSPMEGIPVKLELYRYVRNACFPSMNDFYDAFDRKIAHSAYVEECEQALRTFDHREYLKQFSFHTPEDKKFRFLRDDVLKDNQYDAVMQTMIDALTEQGVFDAGRVSRDLWMDDAALRDLDSAGHVVGLHSYTHPTTLGRMRAEDQHDEYRKNFAHLSRVLSSTPRTMSHPCNSFNAATVTVLQELGITTGFRTDMGKGNGPYKWPRRDSAFLFQNL